jgi:predicted Zn-dependent protease
MRLSKGWGGVLVAAALVLSMPAATANEARLRLHQIATSHASEDDVAAEVRFGEDVAARILGRQQLIKNERLDRYVSLIGTALAAHADRPELNFYFAVVDSDTINAYSAPGGFVFITRGAVQATRDESELAAILAHEIGHVSRRHIVDELNIHGAEQADLSTLSRFLGASADTARVALSQAVDKALSVLFDTGYNVKQELEADRVATLLLAETGYDPTALRRFLARVESPQQGRRQAGMKTHPGAAQRDAALAKLLAEEGLAPLPDTPLEQTRFERHVKTRTR